MGRKAGTLGSERLVSVISNFLVVGLKSCYFTSWSSHFLSVTQNDTCRTPQDIILHSHSKFPCFLSLRIQLRHAILKAEKIFLKIVLSIDTAECDILSPPTKRGFENSV